MTTSGTTHNFFYDDRDNLTCQTTGTRNAADCVTSADGSSGPANLVEKFAYDYRNRPWGYAKYGSGARSKWATYLADPLDRPFERVEKPSAPDAKTIVFSYLGLSDQLSLEEQQNQDGTRTQLRSYSYDADGNRISIVDKPGQNETTYMYGYDVQGSVSQLIDRAGQVKVTYGYTPYGTDDDQLGSSQSTVENPYKYTGKRVDPISGALDMGARMFSPNVSHFLQQDFYEDALGDLDLSTDPLTMNRYALAGGNPIGFVELDGHAPARRRSGLPKACAPMTAKACARMMQKYMVQARPYIEAEARREGHVHFDPFTGTFAVIATPDNIVKGLTKLQKKRSAALRAGRLRGAAARDFYELGKALKVVRPFAKAAGPIGIVGGFIFDFRANREHMSDWDAVIQSSFTTGGEVAGGLVGAAACGIETFVTVGLGAAACPVLVGLGIVGGHYLGLVTGMGARWVKHKVGDWLDKDTRRIAPGAGYNVYTYAEA
jgi:RHS repeat-associated protein